MARKNKESQQGDEGSIPLELTERLHSDTKGLANELGDSAIQTPAFNRLSQAVGSNEEAERVFREHLHYIIENDPSKRRALALTDMYLSVPKGANARDVLRGQIYGQPGRQYAYLNSFAGDEKDSKGLAKKLGGALGTVTQATWRPGLAYAGWGAVDSAVATAGSEGIFGTGIGSAVWSWPLKGAWAALGTPLFYGLIGYAIYKTIKHFRKKGKEKRLKEKQIEELEKFRGDFLAEQGARGTGSDYQQ